MDTVRAPLPPERVPTGLYLAMDTAGPEGSVALGAWASLKAGRPLSGTEWEAEPRKESDGGRPEPMKILARTSLRADEEHSALLVPRIQGLFSEIGADPADLSGIVVGAGPGSFTGVRVGAATAKGMAWSLRVPLWAFSSLAGAAAAVEEESLRPRLVLFDARGDRVYAAAYRTSRGSMETLLAPLATTVGRVVDELVPPGAFVMGTGAVRHRALLEGVGHTILPPPAGHPSAEGLISLLSLVPDCSPVENTGSWEPDYLREAGAERMWMTRKAWGGR